MARILAISSQVARGAVGLSAAVPALQALGHEVIALPTILLSNHPGHARFAGERVAPALLARMLEALEANGWLAGLDAVLTGYLPSAEHVAFAEAAVTAVRRVSPDVIYLCDPVLGDEPKGLYIAADAADAVRARLVPAADVLKMNWFEACWLSGAPTARPIDLAATARDRNWPTTIVTSVRVADPDVVANVMVEPGHAATTTTVTRHAKVPNGTGDLMGALWLGYRLRSGGTAAGAFERSIAGVDRVLQASRGHDELQLAAGFAGLPP